jgi:hypothetical protein
MIEHETCTWFGWLAPARLSVEACDGYNPTMDYEFRDGRLYVNARTRKTRITERLKKIEGSPAFLADRGVHYRPDRRGDHDDGRP